MMGVDDRNGMFGSLVWSQTIQPRHALLFNLVLHSGSRCFDTWVMLEYYVSTIRCVFYVVFTFHRSRLF